MARIVSLAEVSESDLPLVGGKASKLGELVRQGLPVPPGFVLTTEAYDAFVNETVLKTELPAALATIETDRPETIEAASLRIRKAFETAPFPPALQRELETAYEMFARQFGVRFCAVRSSATAEDLEGASFAGLQDTYLNITGTAQVVAAVRKCWGSLFTPRVLIYRHRKGFDQGAVRLAVLIQKMVDATVSGILFTRDPNTGENHMIVEAGWGLGEAIVGGEVTPDHYVIDGASQKIVHKQLSEQRVRLIRAEGGGNRREDVPADQRSAQKLPDHRLQRLVSLARLIESHYRRPMDVEWCGDDDTLYIVQARPVTTIPKSTAPGADEKAPATSPKAPTGEEPPFLRGFGASPGVAAGVARILHGSAEMEKLKPGEILVTSMTTPDMVPAMSRAAGIVTDEGGMTCHAAIVSRELGVPCIVGTREATKLVVDGGEVTVDGKTGSVYRGIVHLGKAAAAGGAASSAPATGHAHEGTPITATKIYVNVGVPEKAEEYARLPVSGVGLLRIEFIFTAHIREHPLALLKKGKKDELVRRLADGIGKVCQAFHPRPVIIRTSDFKTNEYRGMPGGEEFEPVEENPMIGWRGCSRYISPVYRPAFLCELEAIHRVRTEMGLKNAMVMLPFVRNTWELEEISEMMRAQGLRRSRDFQLYLMAEVPSVALLAREFSKHCDGFSIGSNDLTQLTLGVDRDSETVAFDFDERDPGMLEMLRLAVAGAKRNHRKVGICGEAPANYPEIARFLAKLGIDSMSVNPSSLLRTIAIVHEAETAS